VWAILLYNKRLWPNTGLTEGEKQGSGKECIIKAKVWRKRVQVTLYRVSILQHG
jgi:hypothetical protein